MTAQITGSIEQDVCDFATKLLERRGGLVEWADRNEGTAIVPAEMAALLDVESLGADSETIQLSTQPGSKGWCLSLATDFLDTASQLLELEPRVGTFCIPEMYLKRGDFEELVRREFSWLNARVRLQETRSVRVEYHTWWFHALLASEDRWETRFPITINAASGTEVKMPNSLELWELEPHPTATQQTPTTYQQAVLQAQRQIQKLASKFLDRMDGRLGRDRKRLREYYNALLRESHHKKSRRQTNPDSEQPETEKLEAREKAVKLEMRRKAIELDERYAMDLTLEPVVLTRMEIPALAIDLSVERKRARRMHTVYWNSLLKQLEPICCIRCGCGTFSVAFTNEEVDPFCANCSD
jgi:hypothetical protein